MGDLKKFEVYLDHKDGIYYGGQTLSGRLELELGEELSFKGNFNRVRSLLQFHLFPNTIIFPYPKFQFQCVFRSDPIENSW